MWSNIDFHVGCSSVIWYSHPMRSNPEVQIHCVFDVVAVVMFWVKMRDKSQMYGTVLKKRKTDTSTGTMGKYWEIGVYRNSWRGEMRTMNPILPSISQLLRENVDHTTVCGREESFYLITKDREDHWGLSLCSHLFALLCWTQMSFVWSFFFLNLTWSCWWAVCICSGECWSKLSWGFNLGDFIFIFYF